MRTSSNAGVAPPLLCSVGADGGNGHAGAEHSCVLGQEAALAGGHLRVIIHDNSLASLACAGAEAEAVAQV